MQLKKLTTNACEIHKVEDLRIPKLTESSQGWELKASNSEMTSYRFDLNLVYRFPWTKFVFNNINK